MRPVALRQPITDRDLVAAVAAHDRQLAALVQARLRLLRLALIVGRDHIDGSGDGRSRWFGIPHR